MNMKPLTSQEIKARQLEIVDALHNFCIQHDLTYFMNYGTLIGAVRHQGVIPWDDDMDFMMPRKDYQKFIQAFPKDERFQLLSLETNKKYYNNFAKLIDTETFIEDTRNSKTYPSGVFIDIFPYDRFDDMKVVEKTYIWESLKLLSFSKQENITYGDSMLKDVIRTIIWFILRPISPRVFAHKIEQVIHTYKTTQGKYEGLLASKFKQKEVFPAGIFDDIIELVFEERHLPAPKEYDKLLTQYYGNYMELPPKDKQVNPHGTIAYLKRRG